MALETLACPKCGSPLQVGPGDRLAKCAYCGSTVPVVRSLAAATGEATEILARRTAIEALEQRLADLVAERARLEHEMPDPLDPLESDTSAVRTKGGVVGCIAVVGGLIVLPTLFAMLASGGRSTRSVIGEANALAGLALALIVFVILAAGADFLSGGSPESVRAEPQATARDQGEAEVQRRAEESRPAMARLDEEIASTQERIATLKQELQDLAGRL